MSVPSKLTRTAGVQGSTPLFQASLWGFGNVVGDLIAAGANLGLADQVYPDASRSCRRRRS